MTEWLDRCHFGDVRAVLRRMIEAGLQVDCVVTSPPYWGLRSYLPADHPDKPLELGSEPTLREFITSMADVFDLVRQVMKPEGTCWVNMGDSYATDHVPAHSFRRDGAALHPRKRDIQGFKGKDLLMQPHRLAIELQERGWWVRSDIVWSKPNPMPESAKDRPTRSHEYLFQLSASETYYFDFEAFKEPTTGNAHPRRRAGPDSRDALPKQNSLLEILQTIEQAQLLKPISGWAKGAGVSHNTRDHAQTNGVGWGYSDAAPKPRTRTPKAAMATSADAYTDGKSERLGREPGWRGRVKTSNMDEVLVGHTGPMRNRRSVWTIPTEAYHEAHFATFPRKLIEPCIAAGCPPGGTVLDIFMGSGTTAEVSMALGRHWVGIDLDRRNDALQARRASQPTLLVGAE